MRDINSVISFLIVISFVFGDVSCGYTYAKDAGVWLKFHEVPATFTDAFFLCKAEGAQLASPTDELMTKSITSLLKDHRQSCGIYTGIHSTFYKGVYSTVDGKPLESFTPSWAPGEPDNYENNEECLIMTQNGLLADVKCNDTFPFICSKTSNNSENSACGTKDKEYTLDNQTGSCYKFHKIGRSWVQAYMTCAAEGGYLAIVNSLAEAKVIKNLYANYPDSVIFASIKQVVGLGFHERFQHKFWLTIHGQTLEEAGFADFNDGQPDNDKTFDGGSHCGAMFRNGRFDDVWCYSVTIPFICEKDPKYVHV